MSGWGTGQPTPAAAPIILSALLGARDFAFFDGLRRAHFPPERNFLSAHLTLFQHLPPSLEPEILHRLVLATAGRKPEARVTGVFSLGRGVAYRIESPALEDIRADLASAFANVLTPQDSARWRPHITVQNKVTPEAARTLIAELERDFILRPVIIAGLAAWWYRGGPWEAIARYPFRR